MRVAMVCPYSLERPGGVQGQVTGLARALRGLGHEVAVLAPGGHRPAADPDAPFDGTHVVGAAVGVRSNGSVAPVALSPGAAWRAQRLVRRHRPDVVHLHEPMAPVLGYGILLTRPAPLVGHLPPLGRRAPGTGGCGRWPPGPAGGSTCAAASPRPPAPRRRRPWAAPTRCSSTGSEVERFAVGPAPGDGPPDGAVPRPPRGAQGAGRAARGVRRGAGPGRAVGGRGRPGHRGAAAGPPRVGADRVARAPRRRRGGPAAGRGPRAVRPVTAGRVVRHGAPRGAGRRLRRGGHRPPRLPRRGGRPRRAGAARRHRRLGARPWPRPWPTPPGGPGPAPPIGWLRGGPTPRVGRWTAWPDATWTSTTGPAKPGGPAAGGETGTGNLGRL